MYIQVAQTQRDQRNILDDCMHSLVNAKTWNQVRSLKKTESVRGIGSWISKEASKICSRRGNKSFYIKVPPISKTP